MLALILVAGPLLGGEEPIVGDATGPTGIQESPAATVDAVPPAASTYNHLDGMFVENLGQKGDGAGAFYCMGERLSVAIGADWFSYLVVDASTGRGHLVRVGIEGGGSFAPVGAGPSDHSSNFLIGSDPAGWVRGARSFEEVLLPNVYEGIDLRFATLDGCLKYEFLVGPGADPSLIALRYEGADGLWIDGRTGDLVMGTSVGTIRDTAPVSFQFAEGGRADVDTSFRLLAEDTVGFDVADHDVDVPLVIDPTLHFSTFLGGSSNDEAHLLLQSEVDDGYLIAGRTSSSNFPTTPGANDTLFNSTDGFVSKISSTGSTLMFSTFIGGTGSDGCTGMCLDSQERIYVTGETTSDDFPVTDGTMHTSPPGGGLDAFVARLSADASDLELGTYFGGSAPDTTTFIHLDGSVLTIGGSTESTNMPQVTGCYDTTSNGGVDLFIAKIDSLATQVLGFTYLGGSQDDDLPVFRVGDDGTHYVSAHTQSNNFPVSSSAYQRFREGDIDLTMSRLSEDLGSLLYSTYLGGSRDDEMSDFELLSNGSVLLTGNTISDDFPTTAGSYDTEYTPNREGIIVILGKDGDKLEYGSYFGGKEQWYLDACWFATFETDDILILITSTYSLDFPAPNTTHNGSADMFLCRVDLSTNTILSGSYIGGSGLERPHAYIREGELLTIMGLGSSDFPTTRGCHCPTHRGGNDIVLFKTTIDLVAGTVPSAPRDLTATAGDWLVNLTWEPPSDLGNVVLRGYRLYSGDTPENLNKTTRFVELDPTLKGYDDHNVVNGRRSYYALTAWNWWGESERSNVTDALPLGKPNPPLNLSAEALFGGIRLTWEEPNYTGGTPILGYRLFRGLAHDDMKLLTNLGLEYAYTDSPLESRVRRYYQVMAFNMIGNGSLSTNVSAVPTGLPTEPTGLRLTPCDGQVLLEWTEPIDNGGLPILGYRILKGLSEDAMEPMEDLGPKLRSYPDSNVSNGQTYHYALQCFNANGDGPLTGVQNATPACTPGMPRDFKVVGGPGVATLTWAEPESTGGAPILGYHVYKGLSDSEMAWYADVEDLTYTDTGLLVGVTFYYQVQAFNRVGDGPITPVKPATSLDLPGPPREVSAKGGLGSVTVTWHQPLETGGSPIREWKLYRGTSEGDRKYLTTVLSFITSYKDSDVETRTVYYYSVSAITDAGEGGESEVVHASSFELAGPPAGFTATPDDRRVILAWQPPENDGGSPVAGYVVLRGTTVDHLEDLATGIVNLTHIDGTAVNGVKYYYAVVAVTAAGRGNATEPVEAVPRPPPSAPGKVKTLGVDVEKDGKVVLAWMAPEDDGGKPVTGYVVLRGRSAYSLEVIATLGLVTSWTDETTEAGKIYFYSVAALNDVGQGKEFAAYEVDIPPEEDDGPGFASAAVVAACVLAHVAVRRARTGRRNDVGRGGV